MNPGTFQGVGTGAFGGGITRYVQTPAITTSQTIPVPVGTKRIEALLVGGGGGGGYGGGGFGGAAVIEVPVTGQPLQVVIGAGGAANTDGSPTHITSAGTRYAEVGGGGAGGDSTNSTGRSGGGGGGGGSSSQTGKNGGCPPIGNVLWFPYPSTTENLVTASTVGFAPTGAGVGGLFAPQNGSLGGGGAGGVGTAGGTPTAGAYGGGGGANAGGSGGGANGNLGGGGGGANQNNGGTGGSLTSISIWGYTGFAGGSPWFGIPAPGGGGGGFLSAGSSPASSTLGGAGGDGGGGGGGASFTPGAGGNGMAVLRFYF